ncbi:MAG: hypothetical protein OJJ55_04575 [Rhodococcus sp.]|nr:hypothetical protein [Rhodococcus sp. (in: high G+C Gram-positive bacteria)]
MASDLKQVLTRLSEEPEYLSRFKSSPEEIMTEAGLSEEDKTILITGDVNRMRAALTDEGAQAFTVTVVIVAVVIIAR